MRARVPARVRASWRRLPFVLMLALLATGCGSNAPFGLARPVPATAHERYARALVDAGLDSTALGREWLAASDSALRTPFDAALPVREVGVYERSEARAVAYRVALRDGQRLVVTLRADGLPARLYLDLFEVTSDTSRPYVHRATADTTAQEAARADTVRADSTAAGGMWLTLRYEAARDGQFVVRLQPELLRSGRFELTMRAEPTLAFPVSGRGNSAIQSLFGVARDGGRRAHHGIDIFAPRGTPVVAAADGYVRSTAPNTLGGKVIWLRDELRGQTFYYAHLDSALVSAGQFVLAGDTIGLVGNTGNARTTPPHLHFGIYRRGQGPVDPLVHVRRVTAELPVLRADTTRLGTATVTRVAGTTLRAGPSARGDALRELPRAARVQLMGVSAAWYRVQFEDGTAGYVVSSTLERD